MKSPLLSICESRLACPIKQFSGRGEIDLQSPKLRKQFKQRMNQYKDEANRNK